MYERLKRATFYLALNYSSQLSRDDDYSKLKKTVEICILDFEFLT